MHTSLTTVGRRAGVLAVATALTLITTACVPEGAGLSASAPGAATGDTTPSQAGATAPAPDSVPPAARAEQAVVEVPPVPVAPDSPVTAPAGTDGPEAEPVEAEAAGIAADQILTAARTSTAGRGHGSAGRGGWTDSAGHSGTVAAAPAAPAAAVAPVAAAISGGSAGSGGSYANQARASFTASNGHTGRYLRYAGGIDASKPVGLVVYVDGTGEYGIDNPTSSYALGGSSGLVAQSRARNMITLAVESPNQACECWHTGDTAGYADFLAELIERQGIGAYPITDVWLAGFSSGAQEITRFLVPRHPELMRLGGGWVVFGGGGPPAGRTALTSAHMAGVRGHWYTGTADTAVPLTSSWGARAGRDWYAARGVTASAEFPSGVGHTLNGRLGQTVARMIDAG